MKKDDTMNGCGQICGDGRFELIAKIEKDIIKSSNITKEETDVLGSILFRLWQRDWLRNSNKIDELQAKAKKYDRLMSMNSLSKNDIKIVLDGNAWCAYRLPFRNLQEDDAGFGATPQIALTALLKSELPNGWEEA